MHSYVTGWRVFGVPASSPARVTSGARLWVAMETFAQWATLVGGHGGGQRTVGGHGDLWWWVKQVDRCHAPKF
jgi:hypothetical protein